MIYSNHQQTLLLNSLIAIRESIGRAASAPNVPTLHKTVSDPLNSRMTAGTSNNQSIIKESFAEELNPEPDNVVVAGQAGFESAELITHQYFSALPFDNDRPLQADTPDATVKNIPVLGNQPAGTFFEGLQYEIGTEALSTEHRDTREKPEPTTANTFFAGIGYDHQPEQSSSESVVNRSTGTDTHADLGAGGDAESASQAKDYFSTLTFMQSDTSRAKPIEMEPVSSSTYFSALDYGQTNKQHDSKVDKKSDALPWIRVSADKQSEKKTRLSTKDFFKQINWNGGDKDVIDSRGFAELATNSAIAAASQ